MAVTKKETPAIITDPSIGTTMTMSVEQYKEWSKGQGKIMGRNPNEKTPITEEKLRVLINTGWNRAMLTEHFGLEKEDIDALLVRMSHKERRDKVQVLH